MTLSILIQIISAISMIFLSGVVAWKAKLNSISLSFIFMCGLTSIWTICGAILEFQTSNGIDPILTSRISMATASILFFSFANFSWNFPTPLGNVSSLEKIMLLMLSLTGSVLALAGWYIKEINIVDGVAIREFLPGFSFFLLNAIFSFSYSLKILIPKYQKMEHPQQKVQISCIFLGLLLGFFISFMFGVLLPLLGRNETFSLSKIGPLVFFVVVSFAITKHRLMDIRVVISRSLAYLILTTFYLTVFTGIVYLLRWIPLSR